MPNYNPDPYFDPRQPQPESQQPQVPAYSYDNQGVPDHGLPPVQTYDMTGFNPDGPYLHPIGSPFPEMEYHGYGSEEEPEADEPMENPDINDDEPETPGEESEEPLESEDPEEEPQKEEIEGEKPVEESSDDEPVEESEDHPEDSSEEPTEEPTEEPIEEPVEDTEEPTTEEPEAPTE